MFPESNFSFCVLKKVDSIYTIFLQFKLAKYFSEKGRHKANAPSNPYLFRFLPAPKFCLPFGFYSNIV